MDTVNEFYLKGRVLATHRNEDGSAYITVLSRNGKDIYVKCYCAPGKLPELNRHSRVCVTGRVNSYMKRNHEGIYRPVQQFIGESVYPDTTLVEQKYGIKGRFFSPFECAIYIKGVVSSIQEDSEWVRMLVDVDEEKDDRRKSSVRLNMRKIDRQPAIVQGDVVYTVCSLSTPRKELNGDTVSFENIVVSDIAVESNGVFI